MGLWKEAAPAKTKTFKRIAVEQSLAPVVHQLKEQKGTGVYVAKCGAIEKTTQRCSAWHTEVTCEPCQA